MIRRSIVLPLLAGVVGLAFGLIGHFPASHAVRLADPPGVAFAGVRGSVWSGGAQRVDVDGLPALGAVHWDVSAWRLLAARLAGRVDFDVAAGRGGARFALKPDGDVRIDAAEFRGPAGGIARQLPVPLLLVDGEISVIVDEAGLREGRPHGVDARLRWDGAAMRQPLDFAIGAVTVGIVPQDEGGHRMTVDVRDGDLRVEGGGNAAADGTYGLELRVEPAADAPADLVDVLASIASREGDAFIIRESGRLEFPAR